MGKRRGFIGPLGDDIPSIFPLVAGILIFIVSFVYIYQQVDARNKYLEVRSATLQMSYIVSEKGFMDDLTFDSKCTKDLAPFASKNEMQYAVILKKYCGQIVYRNNENVKLMKKSPFGVEISDRVCSSDDTINTLVASASNPPQVAFPSGDVTVMSYPIAVDCGNAMRGLGLVSIAGWRRSG